MPVSQNKNHIYGALFVLVCALPAYAGNEDAIASCARIATVGDRILCLEDALRQSSSGTAESDSAADELPATAKQIETSPPSESEVPAPAAQATSILTDNASLTDEKYGLKVQRPPKETNIIQVTVTSVRKNLSNKFIFETEDGQIWLQTDQRTVRYGHTPFEAEIRRASMGSFFLKPASGSVSVRVRRQK